MTLQERVISMWRLGLDTYEITRRMNALSTNEYKEHQIHQIITAERNERKARLGFKTIEGGRNEAAGR